MWNPYADKAHLEASIAELLMDLVFVALGAAIFIAFGVYAALLKRV